MECILTGIALITHIPSNPRVCIVPSHHYSMLLLSNQSSDSIATPSNLISVIDYVLILMNHQAFYGSLCVALSMERVGIHFRWEWFHLFKLKLNLSNKHNVRLRQYSLNEKSFFGNNPGTDHCCRRDRRTRVFHRSHTNERIRRCRNRNKKAWW